MTVARPELRRFLGALACLLLLLAPIFLSTAKVPVVVFYGYTGVLVILMLWLIRRRASLAINHVLLFGIGDDTVIVLFGLVGALAAHNIQRIATNILFIAVFAWLFLRLRASFVAAPRPSAAD